LKGFRLLWSIQVRLISLDFFEIGQWLTSVGWVPETGIGGGIVDWVAQYAPDLPRIPVPESAAGCVKIFETLTIEDTNSFFNFDGSKIAW